jgi:hypothetical protein
MKNSVLNVAVTKMDRDELFGYRRCGRAYRRFHAALVKNGEESLAVTIALIQPVSQG